MKQARLFAISKPDRDADEHALERIWFKELQNARTAYRRAITELKSVSAESMDTSETSPEIVAARRRSSQALIEYQRILLQFTDLLSTRKVPKEGSQESGRATKR